MFSVQCTFLDTGNIAGREVMTIQSATFLTFWCTLLMHPRLYFLPKTWVLWLDKCTPTVHVTKALSPGWHYEEVVEPSGRSIDHWGHALEGCSGTLPLWFSGQELSTLLHHAFPAVANGHAHQRPKAMNLCSLGLAYPKLWPKVNLSSLYINYLKCFATVTQSWLTSWGIRN